ncbi:glycoside hydrolase family 18 [Thermaerobacter marianensis DSM 12885]|uniref:Glycoside hydrolase family 18 n=1 Tax=Thermaerobacter marianensis (strain ATCC 700841 / DSM 12885 / JCM 10246 / 7p75a) TaxID=644966 RepID=E6SK19_THEM7|nr:glycosyl hydrolase family 18 protein [Thermaerobacter marianensis]ADU51160.1 glycoside hydrolase family 18 [Thermaerobacter marianensis DSM 12885]
MSTEGPRRPGGTGGAAGGGRPGRPVGAGDIARPGEPARPVVAFDTGEHGRGAGPGGREAPQRPAPVQFDAGRPGDGDGARGPGGGGAGGGAGGRRTGAPGGGPPGGGEDPGDRWRRVAAGAGRWWQRLGGWSGVWNKLRTDRRWQVGAVAAGLFLLILATLPGGPGPQGQPPLRKPAGLSRPEVLGFFENGWSPVFGDSFPSVKKRPDLIDSISPFWYSIRSDGSLWPQQIRQEVIDFAREHDIRLIPLFNLLQSGGNEAGFLVDPAARSRAVQAIVREVQARGYDGVNIDFELLPPEAEPMMSAFIRELDRVLPQDKRLDIAAFPKVDVDPSVHGGHNWRVFARHADQVILMAYDRHYLGSQPGPVSPAGWVEANLKEMLNAGIAGSQILLGVGAYGYDWPAGAGPGNEANSTPVPLWQVKRILDRYGIRPRWDRESQNPHFTYPGEGGQQREVWYLDERVLQQRIDMVRKYSLGGIAIWRLGYEDDAFWNVIEKAYGPRRR